MDPELSVDQEDGSSVDASPLMCGDSDRGDVSYAKRIEELTTLKKHIEAMESGLDKLDKNNLRFDKEYETVSKATAVASLDPMYQKKSAHGVIPDPNASFVHIERNPHNCRYRWRIPNVARMTREANDHPSQPLVSPPWLTHFGGYTLQTHIYFHGNGRFQNTHISVFLSVLRGLNDSILPWPLNGKISLFLLPHDQKEKRMPIIRTVLSDRKSRSFQQPTSHRNIASGCPDFASVSTLSDDAYVKNDVMFLEFTLNTFS